MPLRQKLLTLIVLGGFAATGNADSTAARCDVYPMGEDHASVMQACTFSQRQGYITLALDEENVHALAPVGDTPGNFRDASGQPVYRVKGLGDKGQIFRFPHQSIHVYWDTRALQQHED